MIRKQVNLLGCSSKTDEGNLIFPEHCLGQRSLCRGCKTCSSCWRGGTTLTSSLVRSFPNCSMWTSSHRLWWWSLVKGFQEQIRIGSYSTALHSKLPAGLVYFPVGYPSQSRSGRMCFPQCIARFGWLDRFCRCEPVLTPSLISTHSLAVLGQQLWSWGLGCPCCWLSPSLSSPGESDDGGEVEKEEEEENNKQDEDDQDKEVGEDDDLSFVKSLNIRLGEKHCEDDEKKNLETHLEADDDLAWNDDTDTDAK